MRRPFSEEATMTETRQGPSHTAGDLLYDAIYIAGLGGGIVALFFLAYDKIVFGEVLFTPSLLGSVLFMGVRAEDVHAASMEAATKFTIVHIIASSVMGLVLSWLIHQAEMRARHPILVIGIVFLLLEIGIWSFTAIAAPGVMDRLGLVPVAAANLLAAVGIGVFLVISHRPEALRRILRSEDPTRPQRK
jgi:hypothetical protein